MCRQTIKMDRDTMQLYASILKTDSAMIQARFLDMMNNFDERETTEIEYLRSIVAGISTAAGPPLLPKTPKAVRKKAVQRIKTIPENDVMNDSRKSNNAKRSEQNDRPAEEEAQPARTRRAASQKATESIKKQQSLSLHTKLRRPSSDDEAPKIVTSINQSVAANRSKRPKTSMSSEEDDRPPSKLQKTGKAEAKNRTRKIKEEPMSPPEKLQSPEKPQSPEAPPTPPRRTRSSASLKQDAQAHPPQRSAMIDETIDAPDTDVTTTEASVYEDAMGKLPMNSTMNPNTTVTIDRKIMNATVILDRVNETIVISKSSGAHAQLPVISPLKPESAQDTRQTLQSKLQALKADVAIRELEDMITDDESSPERKEARKKPKYLPEKLKKQRKPSPPEEDDEEARTPPRVLRQDSAKPLRDAKYKTNAFFSPYAKESVKKKVEAFEQAVQKTPGNVEAPTRITRTKTRAMAAAEENAPQTLAQKLARKSLAKAKRISLNRQKREDGEGKENLLNSASKLRPYLINTATKTRATPISKAHIQMPSSVSRLHHTPASQIPPPRAMTASKAPMSSTESLISKPLSKSSSTDSLAEKKKLDEDARRKKEETLKAFTEEKKRKREEKELKNKLAREAKEKLDYERRLKLEREREDKARQAQLALEKLREEAERKKLAQLQRAQEKEERRRQEEQLRLQKIQEQEEAERQLLEQKRKEVEAERRRIQELKNQQVAAMDSVKLKAQMMAKAKQKANGPQTYILDSDPDDESDDESRPKHPVPHWAKPEIRKSQLEMQEYIPFDLVLKFFGTKKCTPNLSELFVGIKKDRLKRTSSAEWKPLPRFSMMEDD